MAVSVALGGVVGAAGLQATAHGSPGESSPGAEAETVWSGTTPLVDGRNVPVPGLRGADSGNGVSTVRFSPSGAAVVGEKSGRIALFDSPSSRSGTLLTDASGGDLTADTLSCEDTGLGGVALDPQWPQRPYVYALYTSNAKHPAQGKGKWRNEQCPEDGRCIVDGKLERLTVSTRTVSGAAVRYVSARRTLIGSGWCQAARTHSVGDLMFAPDGTLYASAGDGTPPYGGNETQKKLCAEQVDPRHPSQMAPLDARDPSVRASLNGKVIRINPSTGAGAWGNPWQFSSDPNRRRIVAMGFRNPYRLSVTPTGGIAVSMGGQTKRETVYELPAANKREVGNAGWPCWEGTVRFGSGTLCNGLEHSTGTVMTPAVEWAHHAPVATGERCPTDNPSVAMGVTYGSDKLPARYRKALFFNDFGRGCVWYRAPEGRNAWLASFDRRSVRSMTTAPDGQVYFADFAAGEVGRFRLS